MITITENAKKHFQELMFMNNIEAFYFGVKSGGCSGFNYELADSTPEKLNENDEILEFDDVKIIVDGASILYLTGTEIDWVEDLMGDHFEFSNPLAANSCGCNKSFSV